MSDDKAKADCLASAMEHAECLGEIPMVIICQGHPRCDYTGDGPPRDDCVWCVRIRADDPRDPEEIIAAMKNVQ